MKRIDRVSTRPRAVTAFGAAKINIGLRVGSRRPDGYHDVCGLVHTVSLVDRIEISLGEAGGGVLVDPAIPLRLRAPGAEALETPDNLVARVAAELSSLSRPRATAIAIHKAIPIAAGLGGGSADAAAALAALNVAWGAGLDPRDLMEVGARVSSDVPAILAGGLVHIGGRGERVRRLGAATAGAFVLGISEEPISAADAYATFDDLGPTAARTFQHNDLEAAACALVPDVVSRIGVMKNAGADPVFVSGSGPTVVGVASSELEAHEIAQRAGVSFARVEVVRPLSWGVRVTIGSEDRPID